MNAVKRTIAASELILILPAVLFMTALFMRNLQPEQYEPARTAGRLVGWFSVRPVLGLDVFLVALPLAALVIGSAAALQSCRNEAELRQATRATLSSIRSHLAALLIAASTLIAAGILAIVALHVITD